MYNLDLVVFIFAVLWIFHNKWAVTCEDVGKLERSNGEQRFVSDKDEDDSVAKKQIVNFASDTAGAVVLGSPEESKSYHNLLNYDKDKYGICPCSAKKWVTIGLSEDILVTQVVIINYEKYSSTLDEFQVLGSTSYPVEEWLDMGKYEAQPVLGKQPFNITIPTWARYLKIKFLSHHGNEYLCTLTQIIVHGKTALETFKEEVALADAEVRTMHTMLNNNDDVDSLYSSFDDTVVIDSEDSEAFSVDAAAASSLYINDTSDTVADSTLSDPTLIDIDSEPSSDSDESMDNHSDLDTEQILEVGSKVEDNAVAASTATIDPTTIEKENTFSSSNSNSSSPATAEAITNAQSGLDDESMAAEAVHQVATAETETGGDVSITVANAQALECSDDTDASDVNDVEVKNTMTMVREGELEGVYSGDGAAIGSEHSEAVSPTTITVSSFDLEASSPLHAAPDIASSTVQSQADAGSGNDSGLSFLLNDTSLDTVSPSVDSVQDTLIAVEAPVADIASATDKEGLEDVSVSHPSVGINTTVFNKTILNESTISPAEDVLSDTGTDPVSGSYPPEVELRPEVELSDGEEELESTGTDIPKPKGSFFSSLAQSLFQKASVVRQDGTSLTNMTANNTDEMTALHDGNVTSEVNEDRLVPCSSTDSDGMNRPLNGTNNGTDCAINGTECLPLSTDVGAADVGAAGTQDAGLNIEVAMPVGNRALHSESKSLHTSDDPSTGNETVVPVVEESTSETEEIPVNIIPESSSTSTTMGVLEGQSGVLNATAGSEEVSSASCESSEVPVSSEAMDKDVHSGQEVGVEGKGIDVGHGSTTTTTSSSEELSVVAANIKDTDAGVGMESGISSLSNLTINATNDSPTESSDPLDTYTNTNSSALHKASSSTSDMSELGVAEDVPLSSAVSSGSNSDPAIEVNVHVPSVDILSPSAVGLDVVLPKGQKSIPSPDGTDNLSMANNSADANAVLDKRVPTSTAPTLDPLAGGTEEPLYYNDTMTFDGSHTHNTPLLAACVETLNFTLFQSKMNYKLTQTAQHTGPSSAVGAGDASSSVDSVFRSLMSKIKSLERNYAIIELYTIQSSECYRLMMLEVQSASEAPRQVREQSRNLTVMSRWVERQIEAEQSKNSKYTMGDGDEDAPPMLSMSFSVMGLSLLDLSFASPFISSDRQVQNLLKVGFADIVRLAFSASNARDNTEKSVEELIVFVIMVAMLILGVCFVCMSFMFITIVAVAAWYYIYRVAPVDVTTGYH